MKYTIPVLVGAAATITAITTAVASANGAFTGRVPWTHYLWGYVLSGVTLLVAGIVAIVAGLSEHSKQRNKDTPGLASQSGSPITIHLENIGNLGQNRNTQQAVAAPSPAKSQVAPNIKVLDPRTTKVEFIHHVPMQLCSFHERSDGSLSAVVICFRNESIWQKTVKSVLGARAQLHAFINDEEIGTGFRTGWLDQRNDTVDLIPGGDARCAVLLIEDTGKLTLPYKVRKPGYHESLGEGFKELDQLPDVMIVNLLDSSDQLLIPPLYLKLAGDGKSMFYRIADQ